MELCQWMLLRLQDLCTQRLAQGEKGLLVTSHQVCRIGCIASSKAAEELAGVITKPVSPTSAQGKIMEQVLLEQVSGT